MSAIIDLRSDTVTKPTPGMLAAMAEAEVGDDVYHEDASTNRFEELVADYLGKEAAVFMPTGTMTNQIAIRVHTTPGDEILCDANSHIILWEAGGPAVHSGVMCQTITTPRGWLTVNDLEGRVRPKDMHSSRTRLLCLENTHNRSGGTVYPFAEYQAVCGWAKSQGLAVHLDGARLWNAIVASGVPGRSWCDPVDTVSVCFSKGLGTPVGSVLAGPLDLMARARALRKLFGGGMRQIGYLTAACAYALKHHVDRLAEDHANAQLLADAVRSVPHFRLNPSEVETNLVWFDVEPSFASAAAVVKRLADQGIRLSALGAQTVRACTHYDVSRSSCETAAAALRQFATS